MLNELIPDEKQALDYLTYHVAERLADGMLPNRIADELNRRVTWPHDERVQFVQAVERRVIKAFEASPEGRKTLAPKRKMHMLYGLLWLAGGTVTMGIIYLRADPLALYFISWGAMLWGVIQAARGFMGLYRSWGP